jgi:dTDP-4-dehydrorhamnose 3,5-epimerase
MFDIQTCSLPGVLLLKPKILGDDRGSFIKTFHCEYFRSHNLMTSIGESYYSVSIQGVLRGLHFQLPPKDHEKLVYCISGDVMDVVVDLRRGSPAYSKHEQFELSSRTADGVYIPRGCAHGFFVLSKSAVLHYSVGTPYSPECDTGILWNSLGIQWPTSSPILSERDRRHPAWKEFDSPFQFETLR